jgi:hypothetical protein
MIIGKRHSRVLLAVCILGVIVLYFRIPQLLFGRWALPYYEKHRNHEDNLPHYNIDAPYPNGQHAKYISFGSHQRGAYILYSTSSLRLTFTCEGVGWGNVVQEMILNAFLAYSAKRS